MISKYVVSPLNPDMGSRNPLPMLRPETQRRLQLAQALQLQAQGPRPMTHPMQGIAQLAQALAGVYAAKKAEKDASFDRGQYGDIMTQALRAGKGWTNPDTGMLAVPGSRDQMAQVLMGSPFPAQQQMGMQQAMGQFQTQDELEAEKRKLEMQKDFARFKFGLGAPKTRTVKRNGKEVTEEFDPASRTWNKVGESGIGMISPEALRQKSAIAERGRNSVNVTVGGEKEFAKQSGKNFAETLQAKAQGAQDAADSLRATQDARGLLDKGVITGFGADFKVGLGKALQAAGINYDDDAIANTEAFGASRAKEVGRIIKLFGAGTGLSDADRAYAQKAAAGEITMNEKSIRRILDINERASWNVIQNYSKLRGGLGPEYQQYYPDVQLPANIEDQMIEQQMNGAGNAGMSTGADPNVKARLMQKYGLQ